MRYGISVPCKQGLHDQCAVRWKVRPRGQEPETIRCLCGCHPENAHFAAGTDGKSKEAAAHARP